MMMSELLNKIEGAYAKHGDLPVEILKYDSGRYYLDVPSSVRVDSGALIFESEDNK